MVILEDTRQQVKKHTAKHQYFCENSVEVVRTKLAVGDYTLPADQSRCIDTKYGLLEVCGNVTQQHRRFVEELDLAKKLGIELIILCEESGIAVLEDVKQWKNPRRYVSPKALEGETLYKILKSIEERHGCRFLFCRKEDAGKKIVELLAEGKRMDAGGDEMPEFLEYTKKDFLEGTEPYEILYKHREDEFVLLQMLEQMSDIAVSVGVKGFKTMFKKYCEAKKKESSGRFVPNSTNFDGQPLELDCGEWIADDDGIRIFTPMGGYALACIHPILPVMRLVNIDTNTEKLQLAYRKGGIWRKTIADKRTLASASSIVSLADVGIAVNSENAKLMVRYLHDAENLNYDRIEEKNSVGRLGWVEDHGFAPYVENIVFDGDAACKGIFESVRSNGSYEEWLKLAREIRQESIYGRILMAASFASVLVKPLNCLPFFLHLWGGTEAGKTVGEMLAASVWADPRVGRYIQTFNSTAVGKERSAAFVGNLPLILDELQIANSRDGFDKDIYMLSEGVGRTRGNKQGGVDLTPTWSNCIITNGEMPLISGASGGGAVNRIIEIECQEALFSDPKRVADTLLLHYGFAGKKALDWMEKYDPDFASASQMYKIWMKEFDKKDTTGKQSMAMSLILTADFILANAVFGDEHWLKPEDVQQFLKTKQEVSVHERAYEYICETLVANKNRFGETDDDRNEVWGTNDEYYFYVIRSRFEQLCRDGGYNSKALLSWMKQSGKIEATKGCTKAKRVNGEVVSCVWIVKQKEEQEGFDQIGLQDKSGEECPF